MSPNNDVEMVIDLVDDLFNNCDNYDEGHILVSNTHHPRSLSLFSSDSKEDYATRVQRESDRMVEDDSVTPTDSTQLEYVILRNKGIQVSKVTEPPTNSRQQHVENIGLAINNNTVDNNNVFNIQLNYNINQALNPEF